MSQLCAENILTWHKFLDSVVGKEEVRRKLANEHHMERVRRWTEGESFSGFVLNLFLSSLLHASI